MEWKKTSVHVYCSLKNKLDCLFKCNIHLTAYIVVLESEFVYSVHRLALVIM